MARKRLSDLLREEAKKPLDAEPEVPSNGTRRSRTTGKAKAPATKDVAPAIAVEAGNPAAIAPNDQPSAEALKTQLEQAHQREVDLERKVYALQIELDKKVDLVKTLELEQTKLQAEFDQRTEQIQTLQSDQEKVKSLKTELEQAKKAALQLAEENTRLNQELTTLRTKSVPQAPQPQPRPPASPPATTTALTKKEAILQQQTKALAHPVFPTTDPLPGQLSDKDLGWVD